jgi:peptidoglycan/xylan/chitin deacetylase (PgdA/CDA1 family)/glycosyltransferase involved in cell wall biosynthesis
VNVLPDVTPAISVVVPTFQRRDSVLACAAALERQRSAPPFEVIVVVDGSTDGSADALRELTPPFSLRVVEQRNQGAAAARNAGAALARGAVLLFLDDDMEADPRLLAEHGRSHEEGADAVVGHLPLHPASPRSVLSVGVGAWADLRCRRLSEPGAQLTLHDLLTGQLSIKRETFEELSGFDAQRFTADGTFGGEDLDFGYRLVHAARRITFNPRAISFQRYIVAPRDHYRQWRDAGRSDVVLSRKHPELAEEIARLNGVASVLSRHVLAPLMSLPVVSPTFVAAARAAALARLARGREDHITQRLVYAVQKLEYLRGAHEARARSARGSVTVLAYHAICDLAGDPILTPYGVPPQEFARHLETLAAAGYRFVGMDELIAAVDGERPFPARAVMLTFDDCYDDLLDSAAPLLAERRIPAVAFAVASQVGATNVWDTRIGTGELRLLDVAGLRALQDQGFEIGSHSLTHPDLCAVDEATLAHEVLESKEMLERAGVGNVRSFSYPYGLARPSVVDAVRTAGYDVAFTLAPASVRAGADPHQLPRVEVLRGDSGIVLRLKLFAARHRGPLRTFIAFRHRRRLARGAG